MPDLEYYLAQARRIEEHREAQAEAGMRKAFKSLLKNLQGFLGEEYAENSEDGKLSYEILQKKARYARFIDEVEKKVIKGTEESSNIVKKTVNDTYKAAFDSMIDGVKKADGNSEELEKAFKSVKYVKPETLKNAVENPISGLTLNDTLEKNRSEIVYNIKQTVGIGLQNGDRYETMARRVAESLDGDYQKAIRIVRTETHRVQQAGGLESVIAIDEKLKKGNSGMRYCKIWKTSKDERVRKPKGKNKANHRKMEGVTILVDEYFDLGNGVKAMAPGMSGDAGNDINCRCRLSFRLKKVESTEKADMAYNSAADWSNTKTKKHTKEEQREIVSYAEQKGINIYNISAFDGDVEILKEQIDVLSDTLKEYNIGNKVTITFSNKMDDEDFAQTNNFTITFNAKTLRDRNITNKILNNDNRLSSTDIKGIVVHETGHLISKKYGEKGLEIAKKAYYNIYKEEISYVDLLAFLEEKVSEYSSDFDEGKRDRTFKSKYCKEVLPEILAKNKTNPDEFTKECIRLLKEMIL